MNFPHIFAVPDVDSRPGALPILPWDDDLLIRLSFIATR
jgi:hypothetical protein